MMENKITMTIHRETELPIHECAKASKIAMEYLKLRNPIVGDDLDSFIPSEYELIKKGKLPSYHGRLSDIDAIVKGIVEEYGVNSIHELPQDIKAFYVKFIEPAPTVLDATFEYKMKNYACVKGVMNEISD